MHGSALQERKIQIDLMAENKGVLFRRPRMTQAPPWIRPKLAAYIQAETIY